MRILITGNKGFIGSHLEKRLRIEGHEITGLDSCEAQVHVAHDGAYRIGGYNKQALKSLMGSIDVVFHLAARVGVGQSMYEVADYVSANTLDTAILLEAMRGSSVKRLIVASSMSVYGEGAFCDPRSKELLDRGSWEPNGAAMPTPEFKPPDLTSVYALTKYDQEQLCLMCGEAVGIPTVALRFFNVVGAGQSLNNPYTGVVAIFASRLLNNKPPIIFEDGNQTRDFVHVSDVVQALCLARELPHGVYNVGTGKRTTINEVARILTYLLGKTGIHPEITNRYRVGDIRHCWADIRKISSFGYKPTITLEDGLEGMRGWLAQQTPADHTPEAVSQLEAHGLLSQNPLRTSG